MKVPPRVVCFDLGGVVVRICRTFEEAVLAARVPLRPGFDDFRRRVRAKAAMDAHQLGQLDSREFHIAMSEAFGGLYSAAEFALIHAAITRDEYDGITTTIRTLGELGLVTACLSNTNELHWNVLVDMPALRSLHHRFASHLWGLAKPDAAIYRRFERELGVGAQEILFFDDLRENIEAARSLGWDAVLIDHAASTAEQVECAALARGLRCR
ncbi:MAG: HAD-IA family hydrolase [Phycisphaerae bacterium]|nr:HAD-IA family hydrolase [Phycisphaerae bacterium]